MLLISVCFFLEFQVPAPEEEIGHQLLMTDCNKFVVETQELQCPEYSFKVPFNRFQHPRYSDNIHKLTTVVAALRSSIGGVVFLCREPGQIDSIATGNLSLFKERLETWILGLNPTSGGDMLQFEPLSGDNAIWGVVLVKALLPTEMSFPASVDDSGLVVFKDSTTAALSNQGANTAFSSSDPGFTAATPTVQYSETDSTPVSTPEPAHKMTDSAIRCLLGKRLSWISHKKNWQEHVVFDDDCDLGSVVRKYATTSEMFIPSDPIVFTPNHVLEALLCNSERNRMIDTMMAKLDSPKAFAIVSPSWLSHIGREEVADRPSNHVVDILLVTEKGSIHLWTIVRKVESDGKLQMKYLVATGRLTKFLLLKHQQERRSVRVECYLYHLEDNTVDVPQLQQLTKSFFVNNLELTVIQETLAETIVAKETYLKNVTGEACSYRLSAEQWQVIDKKVDASVMVVSGPPGSGKTLLCAHVLQEQGQKTKCIYVCTSEALAAFMESQNTCSVLVVRTDAELRQMIKQGELNNKACIAFDDVHRLSCSDQTAKHLLNLIKCNKDVRVYVFCDNKFQCFGEIKNHFPKVVERCCKRMDIQCLTYPLTEIHRNTRRVMSFLSAVSFKNEIKCLNKLEGDDVEVLSADNLLDESWQNPLIQNILQVLGVMDTEPCQKHYEARDIAVLVDTDNSNKEIDHFREMLRIYIPIAEVHSAATYPRTGIVLDTLDSFHGLDAGICFYVLSLSKIKKRNVFQKLFQDSCKSIYNPKYLAFLTSRAIYKAVFLVPKLDVEVFRQMLFDYFDVKVNIF